MFTQAGRLLSISSPLGGDELLLEALEGEEAVSRPFEFRLDLLSADHDLDPAALIGQPVSFAVNGGEDEALRPFNGIVRSLSRGGFAANGLRRYRAVVVPWLWLLGKRRDCRIFQEMTVPEILTDVFEKAGFTDFTTSGLSGEYPVREYCVQYNESDLDFVQRLAEEEGIFYFFEHEPNLHNLVLADSSASYLDCEPATVDYHEGDGLEGTIQRWERRFEFVSGRWSHTDYNDLTPQTDLFADSPTVMEPAVFEAYEQFEYPGRHNEPGHGAHKAKVSMEAEESGYEVIEGGGRCPGFLVAGCFELTGHASEAEAGSRVVVLSLRHSARDTSYSGTEGGQSFYENQFTAIPDTVAYRPPCRTQRPRIHGPQTAVVVGPAGEEIYTDEHGRIKAQFHWDRVGQRDENSSCFMRVASSWAQGQFGSVVLPRIGMEVVVEFLDGNPDRPLVTGCVYHADHMPPYGLPESKTQSGFKTRSTPGGSPDNFNELRFEDKKGEEEIFLHAERDRTVVVKHNNNETTRNNASVSVQNDRTISIGNNETSTIGNDRTETVSNNDSVSIGVDRSATIGSNDTTSVGENLELVIGGNQTVAADGDTDRTSGGNVTEVASGNGSYSAGSDLGLSGGGNLDASAGMNASLGAGANIEVTAGGTIKLYAGGSSITIGARGIEVSSGAAVTISGATVEVN